MVRMKTTDYMRTVNTLLVTETLSFDHSLVIKMHKHDGCLSNVK